MNGFGSFQVPSNETVYTIIRKYDSVPIDTFNARKQRRFELGQVIKSRRSTGTRVFGAAPNTL